MSKLRVLDLFSGIGGFSLGLERTGGFETVAFCEIDPFCRKVLAKHWPAVPVYDDVRNLDATGLGRIDCVTGGYPCQPFSLAGKRDGAEDDRHLWPAMFAIIQAIRPTWVIGENVAGHISMGLDDVLSDLEGLGYTARSFVIPACAVDAKHRRDRVWILANAQGKRRRSRFSGTGKRKISEPARRRQTMANTTQLQCNGGREHTQQGERQVPQSGKRRRQNNVADSKRLGSPRQGQPITSLCATQGQDGQAIGLVNGGFRTVWLPEPDVGRVAYGVSNRVDRLKSLGNAVVPQIPELIGYAILEAEAVHG